MSGPETKGGEFPETEDWCQGLEGRKGNIQKASCRATMRWSLELWQRARGAEGETPWWGTQEGRLEKRFVYDEAQSGRRR